MALAALVARLGLDFAGLDHEITTFAAAKPSIGLSAHFSFRDECLLEGITSRLWQSWCTFCRQCVLESCIGTTTSSGNVVVAHPHALSEAHVSGAAIRARQKPASPVFWGSVNTVLRYEPTWGDVDVLADIVPRLGPANKLQLQAAFSAGSATAKAIQTIRNAAAHTNAQTMADVFALGPSYITFLPAHPTHALFWTEKSSGDFLISNALNNLANTASAAAI